MSIPSAPNTVPSRVRPFAKTQRPTPLFLRMMLGRQLAPTRPEFDAAVADLQAGDPAMDALLDWMLSYGMGPARKLFAQAIAKGVDSIADCPEPLRVFFAVLEAEPEWLDWDLLNEGMGFIHGAGLTALQVMRDLALMGGYLLSGFNQALVMTGALTRGTAQRVGETGKWWMDCTEPDGLRRFGPGFATTLQVRMVHAVVRRQLDKRDDWDHSVWGLPLNQIDMAATYLGFSVVMLGGLRKLGVQATPRESRGVMMLWSYACWLMGVDARWLRFNERDGAVLLHAALMTQSPPDWTSRELGLALSKEPLERHFLTQENLRRKVAYQIHLSISRYFLTAEQMQQLGLPSNIKPWFPLLTLLPRTVLYTGQRLRPRWHAAQQKRGRKLQKIAMKQSLGQRPAGVVDAELAHQRSAAKQADMSAAK